MIPLFVHKSPRILKSFYSPFVWEIPTEEPVIYLTFDDGPIPDVTEWVMEQLDTYLAKATFFCIGDNVRKYPDVFAKLIAKGHSVGNHTFNHLKGWNTEDETYLENVKQCSEILPVDTSLFRPPYGRIKLSQARPLLHNYHVVMWDVLTGDFEKYLSPERCLEKTLKYTKAGAIVVLHDSLKAWRNMSYVLPRMLAHFSSLGYRFEALPQHIPPSMNLGDATSSPYLVH
ncbi:MAG TPA: polysaccharide deacetylase family protein [Runella sp.]|nr:polysaccharide deacetylase family protein [Runella sp.]HAO49198.1 polysaccharide deacetylase family protein [Runella sp.]